MVAQAIVHLPLFYVLIDITTPDMPDEVTVLTDFNSTNLAGVKYLRLGVHAWTSILLDVPPHVHDVYPEVAHDTASESGHSDADDPHHVQDIPDHAAPLVDNVADVPEVAQPQPGATHIPTAPHPHQTTVTVSPVSQPLSNDGNLSSDEDNDLSSDSYSSTPPLRNHPYMMTNYTLMDAVTVQEACDAVTVFDF